jgi:hypothetical protein
LSFVINLKPNISYIISKKTKQLVFDVTLKRKKVLWLKRVHKKSRGSLRIARCF